MRTVNTFLTTSIVIALLAMVHGTVFSAPTVDELRSKIDERNSQLETLEEEIEQYTQELNKIAGEKKTLESAIRELDITGRKLGADLELTKGEIDTTSYTLEKLQIEIAEQEQQIDKSLEALKTSLRTVNEIDDISLIESFLAHESLSDVWEQTDRLKQFQAGLETNVATLKALKDELEDQASLREEERKDLLSLQSQLAGQYNVISSNKREKDQLLSIKENDEASYEALLNEKRELYDEFQAELQAFEAQLKIELDPNAIPDAGALFRWPLDKIIITQQFGGSEFAKRNPQVYGRPFHNGTDFGTPTGSKIYAPMSGTIIATGDTDVFPRCLSYGRWILVDHNNGLSTLYAHLSHINVVAGQSVGKGEVIGLSGNTGYSTGPHLHFTVYQTEGVRVVRLGDVKTQTNCANAQIPVAPFDAYLDPMQYLPAT